MKPVTAVAAPSKAHPRLRFADKYIVERVLGRGGMGTVFAARHVRLGQRVAIKVLGEELRSHPELVKRFEREARAAGALSSVHAVRIFDIDQTDDGTPFMVMELLSGCDLARIVERDGPQPVGRAVRWLIEACDAIAEAHSLGIVHRDIKPSNLYLVSPATGGSIKVLDFGIAKRVAAKEAAITQGLAPLGTPHYMSPEQVRCAKDVDARSDIWSLGVTLYELLTGRPPFDHDVPQACVAAVAADPVPDPRAFRADLSAELAGVLLRALAKDRNDRFQTVEDLVQALAPFASPAQANGPHPLSASGVRRVSGQADTTLDAEPEVEVPLCRDRQKSEDSVPPAVSRARATSRGRRVRSSLAFAAAAALGVVALVATPQFVGGRIERAASRAATVAPGPVRDQPAAAKVAATPAASAPAADAPVRELSQTRGSNETKPVESAEVVATARVERATARSARAPSRASTPPLRIVRGEPLVHGGLSSPGF